jgi:hypothetical protein
MFRRAESYKDDGPPKWSWQGVVALKPGDEFADGISQKSPQLHYDESMWGEYAPAYSDKGNRAEQTLQGAGCKIVLRLGDNNDMATITNEGNTGF